MCVDFTDYSRKFPKNKQQLHEIIFENFKIFVNYTVLLHRNFNFKINQS